MFRAVVVIEEIEVMPYIYKRIHRMLFEGLIHQMSETGFYPPPAGQYLEL